jgi:hypothetical protein
MTQQIQACCYVQDGKRKCVDIEICECTRGNAEDNRTSGRPMGEGTKCIDYCRVANPDVALTVKGACCHNDTGNCVDNINVVQCNAIHGIFKFGPIGSLTCAQANCGPTPDECPYCNVDQSQDVWGACCNYYQQVPNDGQQDFTLQGCTTTNNALTCLSQGGVFYENVPCSAITCGPYYNKNDTSFPTRNNVWVGCCETIYDDNGEPTESICTDKLSQDCAANFGGYFINPSSQAGARAYLCSQRYNVSGSGLEPCKHEGACCHQAGNCSTTQPYECCLGSPSNVFLGIDEPCIDDHTCDAVEPPLDGCFPPRDDSFPVNRLGWTVDVCANVMFVPYRDPVITPTNNGLVKFISRSPNRINDISQSSRDQEREACQFHIGHPVIHNGFLKVHYCGSNDANQPTASKNDYLANPMTMRETDINGIVEDGATVFVGSYRTPAYSEIQYHSQHVTCGDDPI